MPKTVDNYIIQKELFKDCFLIQYLLCQHKILKKPFTLKKVQKFSDDCRSKQQEKLKIRLSYAFSCIQNQIQILKEFKSQKTIRCLKILKAKNAIYAVYDQHPEKSLQKIVSTQYLTFQKKQTILTEILSLIKQAHQCNVAIGNIQPKYLYLTSDYKIQTSSFLISKKLQSNNQQKTVQHYFDSKCEFFAPQLLKEGKLTKAADIYSLGKILKLLKLDEQHHQLLTPNKFPFENTKQLIKKMTSENYLMRPNIFEIQKQLTINRSRNRSTCGSNTSRDNEQKIADIRGLQSYKSQATLKFYHEKIEASNLHQSGSRKTLLQKRETLNPDLLSSKTKKITLKSKNSLDPSYSIQSSRYILLEVPQIKKSREQLSSKSGSSTNVQSPLLKISIKQKINDMMLIRNLVSFLIQMSLFVHQENSFIDLAFYLIQQALKYTQNLCRSIQSIMKQNQSFYNRFQAFYLDCKKEKQRLTQVSENLCNSNTQKNSYQTSIIEELKKLGKIVINLYSHTFLQQVQASRVSQLSENLRSTKSCIEVQKNKESQQKLFKTLLILKRLEYGSYYQFFKAKVHHPNKKFWKQHYFQFQKTFGGKFNNKTMKYKDSIKQTKINNIIFHLKIHRV